mmetsp:Transcript_11683/g.43543  ORF Transcript_11683/g.43543 Transcript_11683/m.43543 type:complete len:101 (-) Transcript_11683:106-408(-)
MALSASSRRGAGSTATPLTERDGTYSPVQLRSPGQKLCPVDLQIHKLANELRPSLRAALEHQAKIERLVKMVDRLVGQNERGSSYQDGFRPSDVRSLHQP